MLTLPILTSVCLKTEDTIEKTPLSQVIIKGDFFFFKVEHQDVKNSERGGLN